MDNIYEKQINGVNVIIERVETDIEGLSFKPQMTEIDNDLDWAPFTKKATSNNPTPNNLKLMGDISKKHMGVGIVEIGVSRSRGKSFTEVLLSNKPDNIKYLGIDLNDKTSLRNSNKNIFTIKANSFDQEKVRNFMSNIGMEKISLLHIDGWHSVNACVNDWLYTDLLTDDGVVVFHDSNYHPVNVFLDGIDREKYDVKKYFDGESDFGMAIAFKK